MWIMKLKGLSSIESNDAQCTVKVNWRDVTKPLLNGWRQVLCVTFMTLTRDLIQSRST